MRAMRRISVSVRSGGVSCAVYCQASRHLPVSPSGFLQELIPRQGNPFGGLGLTGGILDAAALSDALIAIHTDRAGDEILDVYAEQRRKTFLEIVDPASQANKERMHDSDPETLGERDPFLRMLRGADPREKQMVRQNDKLGLDIEEFLVHRDGAVQGSV